jgi:hypothetical protein
MHAPDHLARLTIGSVGHCAGVDDDNIGSLPPVGLLKMKVLQSLLDRRAICLRSTAAKIDNVEGLFH